MSKDRVVSTGSRIKEEDRIKEQGQRVKEIDTGLRIKGKTRKMKDSGVEWIGEIPEDWVVQNLKSILAERKENNNPIKTDFILSLTNDRGVIPYTEKGDIGNKSKDDLTGYKLAYPNDIVLNSMNVIIGSVGLSEYFGAVSPVYYMLYPRKEEDAVEFFNYVFQTKVFQESLKGYGNGIMEHRLRIPMINLNTVMLPYPTAKEQQKIVNFLDGKVSLIDDTIEKTKQSIEDYKKYKQALITETVTKGLNPDVEMKDSGVEWIGEIPKHWKVSRLKYLFNFTNGLTITKSELKEEGIDCINYGDIHSKYILDLDLSKDNLPKVDDSFKLQRPNSIVKNGDFVFCDTSEDLAGSGNFVFIRNDNGKDIFAGSHTVVAKPKKEFNSIYLGYLLKSKGIKSQIEQRVTGIKVYSITQGILKDVKVFIPSKEEQQQIAEFLDSKCAEINKLVTQKEKLIKDLEIYKKSLIYEYVTGKKRVV